MDTNSDVPVIRERDKDPPIDDGRFLYKIPEFLDTELTLLSRFTATVGVWTSCAVLFITSLLFIVAFSITKWGIVTSRINGDVIEYGLWQACDVSSGDCWFLVGEPSTTSTYICSFLYIPCDIFHLYNKYLRHLKKTHLTSSNRIRVYLFLPVTCEKHVCPKFLGRIYNSNFTIALYNAKPLIFVTVFLMHKIERLRYTVHISHLF